LFDVKLLRSVESQRYASATIGAGRTFQLIRHVGVSNSIPQFSEGNPRIWLGVRKFLLALQLGRWLGVGEFLQAHQLGDTHCSHFMHHKIQN
jgi:hypothetical protein